MLMHSSHVEPWTTRSIILSIYFYILDVILSLFDLIVLLQFLFLSFINII